MERKVYSEGVFGLTKELHGLRHTRLRGRSRVQIQLWLTAAAMNIKRAVRQIAKGATPTAPAQALLRLFLLLPQGAIPNHPSPRCPLSA
jgi:hypothetical protein